MGYVAYVHDLSHWYRKSGPKGKKNIFIRYSEHSKGHAFIGENESRNITEFESWDVTFSKNEFLKKGDVDQDLNLFEMEYQNELLVPNHLGDIH